MSNSEEGLRHDRRMLLASVDAKLKELARQKARPVVLVIDDYEQARAAYTEALTTGGYNVLTAGSGEEGLVLVASASLDLVLLDYDIPGMNGVEILSEIRKQKPSLPVIMVTGNDDPTVVKRAAAIGITGYLVKPVKIAELLKRVQEGMKPQVSPKEKPPIDTSDTPKI